MGEEIEKRLRIVNITLGEHFDKFKVQYADGHTETILFQFDSYMDYIAMLDDQTKKDWQEAMDAWTLAKPKFIKQELVRIAFQIALLYVNYKLAGTTLMGLLLCLLCLICFVKAHMQSIKRMLSAKSALNWTKILEIYYAHKEDLTIQIEDKKTKEKYPFQFIHIGNLSYFKDANLLQQYINSLQDRKENMVEFYETWYNSHESVTEVNGNYGLKMIWGGNNEKK